MSDLNWCTYCDNAINPFSESLYCSEQCLRADALRNHPLLGYTYPEFVDFPRATISTVSSSISLANHPDTTAYSQQSNMASTDHSCSSSVKSYSSIPSLSAASISTTTSTVHPPPSENETIPTTLAITNANATSSIVKLNNLLLSFSGSNININGSTTTLITKPKTAGFFCTQSPPATRHIFTPYLF